MSTAVLAAALAGALAGLALGELWASDGVGPLDGPASAMHEPAPALRRGQLLSRRAARWRQAHGLRAAVLLAGALAGWSMLGWPGMLVVGAGALVASRQVLAGQARRLGRATERGVGPLARSLADAIRGGHSIRGALQFAAEDRSVPASLRGILGEVQGRVARGACLADGLRDLARQGGPQLTLLAAVVALHAERGGALVGELELLADDAERAVRLDEERASATAQARATVRTVAALPLLALAAAQVLGGNFLGTLARHPAALALLVVGLLLEVAAVLVTRRLVARAA